MTNLTDFLLKHGYKVNESKDGKIITAFRRGRVIKGLQADFSDAHYDDFYGVITRKCDGKIVDSVNPSIIWS
ncbi:hypothetical protein [Campylobacter fetus]|uniref:Uncharacterized protein n=1 Tax=Campylobacter fetus subsp. testudinum TaxID=1507806 RepID=A0AAX0H9N6_CAMFE|nr:hypothetical protein [Campylobacter fetus]ALV64627.1 hypothetical protein CFTSP3_0658 [Campylobacter fetus subsp. testudinum Sp3]OCR90240.1 hypothetical protein CFT12S02225_07685 [Campylobacter fetus subsp. testudinum]OCR92548.1 hypothetical protein CFT12S02263_05225 [Campylobacter fetus subsp. testudinum]OCR93830.1 hypothetical protein CFT12S02842_07750 [Campylobacter fetus subsp. testudinum]OCS02674.1 hypothetical protein CFTCF782_07745 [Campylobacter fetus subsp. testudinum]